MKENFDLCWGFTSQMEGPMSNESGDPGGLTVWGVAQTFWPAQRLEAVTGQKDLEKLTREQAGLCFKKEAWDQVRADELPWPADLAVSDSAFNNGDGAAIRNLQGIVGAKRDGVYGPKTTESVWRWLREHDDAGFELAKQFTERRMMNYINRVRDIEKNDPDGKKLGMPIKNARTYLGEYWMPRLMQLWMFVAENSGKGLK